MTTNPLFEDILAALLEADKCIAYIGVDGREHIYCHGDDREQMIEPQDENMRYFLGWENLH